MDVVKAAERIYDSIGLNRAEFIDNSVCIISKLVGVKGLSSRQNRALHLFFRFVSHELVSAGIYPVLTGLNIEIKPTPIYIKEFIWKPIQESIFGTNSTRQLNSKQIDEVYVVISKWLGETTGVHVDFPNELTRFYSEYYNN